jgi:ABC-type nickel/cobalt efflux system permease component RcnA
MKAVAVSLFLLAVLMVWAAINGISGSDSWAERIGALILPAVAIYMFLRVAKECRELERAERIRSNDQAADAQATRRT